MGTQLARRTPSAALQAFVEMVGDAASGSVAVEGTRNHWHLGGQLESHTRIVRAPAGIQQFDPAEMIIRCGAGTSVDELRSALQSSNQICPLDPALGSSTVGGLLAAGVSGHRRLRFGAIRDLLLEAQFVSPAGTLLRAGAPVVKNVSGYDLCRLLVGSFGTLGLIGEVVLRCRPRPQHSQWLHFLDADPEAIRSRLFQPSSVLWNGSETWVLLEGHPADVNAESIAIRSFGGTEVAGGPALPAAGRLSVDPTLLLSHANKWTQQGTWVAELGVGTVHTSWQVQRRTSPAPLEQNIKQRLDPTRRFSPGRLEL